MKMKWITEKTGKNSGKNRGILGAAGRSLKVFLTAGVLGIFLSGTAFAASGEDAYRMAEGTENYADVYDMADLFTDEEEQQLSGQAQTLSEKMKMEAVIVTRRKILTPRRCLRTDFTRRAALEQALTIQESCSSSTWTTGSFIFPRPDR